MPQDSAHLSRPKDVSLKESKSVHFLATFQFSWWNMSGTQMTRDCWLIEALVFSPDHCSPSLVPSASPLHAIYVSSMEWRRIILWSGGKASDGLFLSQDGTLRKPVSLYKALSLIKKLEVVENIFPVFLELASNHGVCSFPSMNQSTVVCVNIITVKVWNILYLSLHLDDINKTRILEFIEPILFLLIAQQFQSACKMLVTFSIRLMILSSQVWSITRWEEKTKLGQRRNRKRGRDEMEQLYKWECLSYL